MTAPTTTPKDPVYGWVLVGIVFILSTLSFGALGAVSVFLKPLATEFGWSRGETAFGYTAIAFSAALFGVLWGVIADRFGTRWFGLIATFAMTGALLLLARQETVVEFYAFYFLFGALGNAVVSAPLFANVGFWFKQRPGLALGITAAGGAFGQGVVPYFAGLGIETWGWRDTYEAMAWIYLASALPLSFFIRESPQRMAERAEPISSETRFVLSDWEVIGWISVAVIFCCNCMSVPIVHLVPLLTDDGMPLETATGVLMVLMFAGVAGRIFGGQLGDRIGALPAYLLMSLGQTLFVVWFPHINGLLSLYALALAFGFTYSGVMSSILVCTRTMVAARLGARAMSLTSFFGWMGMGMGGFVGGVLYDQTGDYLWSYGWACAAGVINLIVLGVFWARIRGKQNPDSSAVTA